MKNFKYIGDLPSQIPIFPLRNCLLLPKGNIKLNIFEPRYLNMIEDAISNNRLIGMVQTSENEKIYNIGCVGKIIHFTETKDNKYLIELNGICRYKIINYKLTDKGYNLAKIDYNNFLNDLSSQIIKIDENKFLDALKYYFKFQNIDTDWEIIKKAPLNLLIISLAQTCPFNTEEKQMLLETKDINKLALNMVSLLEINSAGETKNLN
tara:strand:- start:4160 stop:4783 length:624 start_codon:yes stop_codon:yes gene_type:complete